MFELSISTQYKKDLKLARKRGLDESLLDKIIMTLILGNPLPKKNKDHPLIGNYKDAGNVISLLIGFSYIRLTAASTY